MLEYVPVRFDLYRPLKPCLRWTLQCLISFADRAGKCWPSVRKLAEVSGLSKSTAARHLCELAVAGIITRKRRVGGVYHYEIDARFLPRARLSHLRNLPVPSARTEEKPISKKGSIALPGEAGQWLPRLRAWHRSAFWLPHWGPTPAEPGCWAPGSYSSPSAYLPSGAVV